MKDDSVMAVVENHHENPYSEKDCCDYKNEKCSLIVVIWFVVKMSKAQGLLIENKLGKNHEY